MKILFITNIPSPYRVDFFNELGKYCQLTVLFETDSSLERDGEWKNYRFEHFEGIILRGIRTGIDSAFCPGIAKYLIKGKYDHIVVMVIASPTALLTNFVLRLKKIGYWYEGDGGKASAVTGWKAYLKQCIIGHAEKCFSTSREFDEYCIAYGALPENIYRYPFTSLWERDILETQVDEVEKYNLKTELQIPYEKVILSVGRVIPLKGYDILLNAFADAGLDGDWGICIVGGKPTEELEKIVRDRGLQNVMFIDFVRHEVTSKYYKMADLFVFTTRYDRWGLVINEAMASGLPVVSTRQSGSGYELFGDSRWLYDCEDTGKLAEILRTLCSDEQMRAELGRRSLEAIREYTIENMATVHLKRFEEG